MAYKSKFTGQQIDNYLDSIGNKQDKLVSGTNIKTINGESIVGSGDISISGGSNPIIFDIDKANIEGGDGSESDPGTFTSAQFQIATGMNFSEFYTAVFNGRTVILRFGSVSLPPESCMIEENEVQLGFTLGGSSLIYQLSCSGDGSGSLIGWFLKNIVEEDFYTKEEIDTNKQDKLVSGTNIKTINGESILGEGDLTIGGGAKIYELDLTDRGKTEGYITEEEWNIIKDSDRIKISTNIFSTEIVQVYSPLFMLIGDDAVFVSSLGVQGGVITTYLFTGANPSEGSPYSYRITEVYIPTQTSQLENDSNFITSDGLKTINGESILGSGDITISGGGSSSGSGAYAEVNHGTSDTTFTLTPNTFHIWDEVSSLTLTLGSETAGVANEFLFQFTSGATATSLTLPDDIKWTEELVIEPNKIYQVSILKGLASVLEFSNEVNIFPMYFTTPNSGYMEANEQSIALADYVLNNAVFDGAAAWECYIPEKSVYIDGHEVNKFYVLSKDKDSYPYEWSFSDGYDYDYYMLVSAFYVTGEQKGQMERWDDD